MGCGGGLNTCTTKPGRRCGCGLLTSAVDSSTVPREATASCWHTRGGSLKALLHRAGSGMQCQCTTTTATKAPGSCSCRQAVAQATHWPCPPVTSCLQGTERTADVPPWWQPPAPGQLPPLEAPGGWTTHPNVCHLRGNLQATLAGKAPSTRWPKEPRLWHHSGRPPCFVFSAFVPQIVPAVLPQARRNAGHGLSLGAAGHCGSPCVPAPSRL